MDAMTEQVNTSITADTGMHFVRTKFNTKRYHASIPTHCIGEITQQHFFGGLFLLIS
jgi:hypothetical protein